ncbi:uncharacterized protein TRIADDRAFT_37600 [Trichoplax adhaerens]|uniref:Transporter n=1 Tax=Trichoplax adhaerens TaxID=10228 RepID=B3RVU2_TRIAD|nr:hypothetical protein TRIADDRAFT_37600 [Trichoplax adhaerens]EDV26056.1 hypothetical protein TRIADDRAFT_37600 [Trichoplax adhaerens]|eukprot:XP_002112089.1 hypothetical protein TRIADDRAFT_37600 [Trichoplax adhaerens]
MGEKAPEDDEQQETRLRWDNKAQFILATIGFAVGLGNVWRFPYLVQKNGGGAFLIPYFIMLVIEGIPIFHLELAIGQRLRNGPVGSWNLISPKLKGVGVAGLLVSIVASSYYIIIIAYCLMYLFSSFQVVLPWSRCPTYTPPGQPANVTLPVEECANSNPVVYFFFREVNDVSNNINISGGLYWKLTLCLLGGWIIIYCSILKGIKSSGKVIYFTATFPYLVLFIFMIRGFTLHGFENGLLHLVTPQFEKLRDPLVWLDAATQIFYSLGVGFGSLIAFASYNPIKNKCGRDAVCVSLVNCCTSLFAAVVVFSVLGHMATTKYDACISSVNATMGMEAALNKCKIADYLDSVGSGPGLVFIVFADIIAGFSPPQFWSIIFYFMLLTLGIDSIFGAMETILTTLTDSAYFKKIRKEVLAGTGICFCLFLFGFIFTQRSGLYFVEVFDAVSLPIPLLVIALAEVSGILFVYGPKRLCNDIEYMTGDQPNLYWKACWFIITPLSIVVIIIATIIQLAQSTLMYSQWSKETASGASLPYPGWLTAFMFCVILLPILAIPGAALVEFFKTKNLTLHELDGSYRNENPKQQNGISTS